MSKRRKRRPDHEVDKLRELVLRVLHDTTEGLVLKHLMQNPMGETVGSLASLTERRRSAVKRAAEELVRRGLVHRADGIRAANHGTYPGYKFAPTRFLELEYAPEPMTDEEFDQIFKQS